MSVIGCNMVGRLLTGIAKPRLRFVLINNIARSSLHLNKINHQRMLRRGSPKSGQLSLNSHRQNVARHLLNDSGPFPAETFEDSSRMPSSDEERDMIRIRCDLGPLLPERDEMLIRPENKFRRIHKSLPTTVSKALRRSDHVTPAAIEESNKQGHISSEPYLPFCNTTQSIRLLHVDLEGESVTWRLVNYDDLRKCPPFTAISYRWGEASLLDGRILLNGHKTEIRQSLFLFLQHVKLWNSDQRKAFRELSSRFLTPGKPDRRTLRAWRGPFWVDSLCIDQRSAIEKTHQVKLMSEIYGRAECVLVWFPCVLQEAPMPKSKLVEQMDTTTALQHMLSAQYWRRVWIIQEFILAQNLLLCYGTNCIKYDILCSLVDDRSSLDLFYRSHSQTSFDYLRKQRESRADNKFDDHLPALFEKFHESECDDPRDKIFALLGLAGKWAKIEPDYTITHAKLFAELLGAYWEFGDPRHHYNRLKRSLTVEMDEVFELYYAEHGEQHPMKQLEEWQKEDIRGLLSMPCQPPSESLASQSTSERVARST